MTTPSTQQPRWMWGAYAALFAASIPWYIPQGVAETLIMGFPLWCLMALGCYGAIAALTVWRMAAMWPIELPSAETVGGD